MNQTVFTNNPFPKVGIRPIIDGRRRGVRESLEDQTMAMAKAAAKLISDNLRYPDEAREVNVQGTVVIRFVVEKDGSISNAAIAREIGSGCGREALRVVNMMPRWNPGKQGGKPVRMEFILPVKFSLR